MNDIERLKIKAAALEEAADVIDGMPSRIVDSEFDMDCANDAHAGLLRQRAALVRSEIRDKERALKRTLQAAE